MRPGRLENPAVLAVAERVGKTPAQVLLAGRYNAVRQCLPRLKLRPSQERILIYPLPEDAFDEINRIQMRQRLNNVMNTGVPGFIAKGN
jgi:alcohol dehydrogenase (NADP+)